jgi:hypothetical protein
MKRYTGQKALYEAISRSRAKAKRGNILERFLPEAARQEKPAPEEGQPQVEPISASSDALPVAKEPPPLPVAEKPREPVVVGDSANLKRFAETELPPEKPVLPEVRPQPVAKIDRPVPSGPVQMWWRLKLLQLNAGRIEVSVPYHVGIVAALVVILVVLAAFRIGQKYSGSKPKVIAPTKAATEAAPSNAATEVPAVKPPPSDVPTASTKAAEPASQPKDHWIVLARHKQRAELELVKEYFDKNGVKLTIVPLVDARRIFGERGLNVAALPRGDDFLLVTSDYYNNPQNPGTDGYAERQKIAELGKKYRAPPGKEKFAPNYFADAYGMKITK